MAWVTFPQYRRGRQGLEVKDGSILDAARSLGVRIDSECGGTGTCGRCRVRIEQGMDSLSPQSKLEAECGLREGERLACQARIIGQGRVIVFVNDTGVYSVLSESMASRVELDPQVRRGAEGVQRGMETIDRSEGRILGLAADVGTTTLVVQILDLETGESVATLARKNPQAIYGADVISRIDYTLRHENGLRELQRVIIQGVNELLEGVEERQPGICRQIYDAVIVGNSTMRDIFFGHDVTSLGVIPFEPIDKGAVTRSAHELGLTLHPDAHVYGAPLIGGHAGADALADIVVTQLYRRERPSMVIDIGTNGEVAIGNRDTIMTCSCAAGGAYEGAAVGCGMGALPGAISNVRITNGEASYDTIEDVEAVGMCGSGLIDLLGELLRNGIMTKKAKLKNCFMVTGDIGLCQEDVYQLITAKAGLRLDQDLLIQYYGVGLAGIEHIYLSGAFGQFINAEQAVRIGLLPNAPEKIVKIGNGALGGAREILLSQQRRREAENVARQIEHVKPNEREDDFAYLVAEKMYFE